MRCDLIVQTRGYCTVLTTRAQLQFSNVRVQAWRSMMRISQGTHAEFILYGITTKRRIDYTAQTRVRMACWPCAGSNAVAMPGMDAIL